MLCDHMQSSSCLFKMSISSVFFVVAFLPLCSLHFFARPTDSTSALIFAEFLAFKQQLPFVHSLCFHHIAYVTVGQLFCVGTDQVATQQAQLPRMVMQCRQAELQAPLHYQLQTPARTQSTHPQLLRQRTPPMQAPVQGAARKMGGSQTPLPHPPAPPDRRMPSIRGSCSRGTETGRTCTGTRLVLCFANHGAQSFEAASWLSSGCFWLTAFLVNVAG